MTGLVMKFVSIDVRTSAIEVGALRRVAAIQISNSDHENRVLLFGIYGCTPRMVRVYFRFLENIYA
jgi:hypothetical protein